MPQKYYISLTEIRLVSQTPTVVATLTGATNGPTAMNNVGLCWVFVGLVGSRLGWQGIPLASAKCAMTSRRIPSYHSQRKAKASEGKKNPPLDGPNVKTPIWRFGGWSESSHPHQTARWRADLTPIVHRPRQAAERGQIVAVVCDVYAERYGAMRWWCKPL